MSDLVRKADALPIFCMRCVRVIDCVNDMTRNFKNNCPIKKELDDLPSAEPKWIPVSERLPEENQMCLVCDKGYIGIDTYLGHGGIFEWKIYVKNYDAWMPMPKPYEEGDNE